MIKFSLICDGAGSQTPRRSSQWIFAFQFLGAGAKSLCASIELVMFLSHNESEALLVWLPISN